MLYSQETRCEAVVPVSVTLDIPEDSLLARTKKLPEDDFSNPILLIDGTEKKGENQIGLETEDERNEGPKQKEGLMNGESTFMTPLIRLFRSKRTANGPKVS